ncbi:unnamed protein product, partial [Ranitomeya imitator]
MHHACLDILLHASDTECYDLILTSTVRVPSHSGTFVATTVRSVTFQRYPYDIAVSDTQQRSGTLLRIPSSAALWAYRILIFRVLGSCLEEPMAAVFDHKELLTHSSHMRSGIVMQKEEHRANHASIWSHKGSEDLISVPNGSQATSGKHLEDCGALQRNATPHRYGPTAKPVMLKDVAGQTKYACAGAVAEDQKRTSWNEDGRRRSGPETPIRPDQQRNRPWGKHRVTKRGPALSNPMFTLVTSEDIAESASQKPILRCQRVIQRRNKVLDFPQRPTISQQGPDRPVFVVQWLFDEAQLTVDNVHLSGQPVQENQWNYIQNLGRELRNTLKDVGASFVPACLSHEVITRNHWTEVQVRGTSLPRALHCWDRSLQETNKNSKTPLKGCPFHLMDSCPWPQCNPTCPSIRDHFTGQEMSVVQFLMHLGFDVQKMASQQGMEPSKLLGVLSS